MDLVMLQSEIVTDPAQQGYSGKSDLEIAALLNAVQTSPDYAVVRNDVKPKEFVQAIQPADFLVAETATLMRIQILLMIGDTIDMTSVHMQQVIAGLCGSSSQETKDAVTAIAVRQGSRAEKLDGVGTVATEQDVGNARNMEAGT